MSVYVEDPETVRNYTAIDRILPLHGYRVYVAVSYIIFNAIGFLVNSFVLYVVGPLLFVSTIKVPKSILFYIMVLCISDLFTMIGMLFLISEVILGTWMLSATACTAYLIFDSLNKFIAPIIALLISRTCYATVCLNKKSRENAANLKYSFLLVCIALLGVMFVLWPVFAYSGVFKFHVNPNHANKSVYVIRKCGFNPPPKIELGFNIVACIANYAIPLGGILYWYMSVPFFLRKRAETTLVGKTSIPEAAIRKVITTALVLTCVYVLCWLPYWVSMFAHHKLNNNMLPRTMVIVSYYIHLLPYISCTAYPIIFTVMNRAIKHAHAMMLQNQRRRFRSLTDETLRQVRDKFGQKSISKSDPDTSRIHTPVPPNKPSFIKTGVLSIPSAIIQMSKSASSLFTDIKTVDSTENTIEMYYEPTEIIETSMTSRNSQSSINNASEILL